MDTIKSAFRRYLPIVCLGVFFIGFFWQELVGVRVFACCDNLLVHVPVKSFIASELREGRFPLWNPFVFAGTPLLADINNSALSPFGLLYLVFDPFIALSITIMASFFVASMGMYAFVRSLGQGIVPALASAVVFAYSGTLVWSADDLPVIQVMALTPWMMWAWRLVCLRPSVKWMTLCIAFAVLQVFSGYPHVIYMSWLLMCVYGWHLTGGLRRLFVALIPSFLMTLLVGGVQLLPFLEYVAHSTRATADFAFAQSDSLQWADMLRFVFPSGENGYIGVIAFVFALWGMRAKNTKFFVWSAILSLVIAVGTQTPLFSVLYHIVPGFSLFRSPQNYLFLYTFAMSVLVSYGVAKLRRVHAWGMLVLVFVELVFFGKGMLVTTPYTQVQQWMSQAIALTKFVSERDWRDYRFHVMPSVFFRPHRRELDVQKTSAWHAHVLWANVGMLHGLASTDGTSGMSISAYRYALDPDKEKARVPGPLRIPGSRLASLGVRYIIGNAKDEEKLTRLGYAVVYTEEHVWVYESTYVSPRLTASTGTVEVQKYVPNAVKVRVESPTDTQLIFADVFYPGWRSMIDGKPLKIERAHDVLKAVSVPQGEHEVEFVFDPLSVKGGLLATLSGIALLVIARRPKVRKKIDAKLG